MGDIVIGSLTRFSEIIKGLKDQNPEAYRELEIEAGNQFDLSPGEVF